VGQNGRNPCGSPALARCRKTQKLNQRIGPWRETHDSLRNTRIPVCSEPVSLGYGQTAHLCSVGAHTNSPPESVGCNGASVGYVETVNHYQTSEGPAFGLKRGAFFFAKVIMQPVDRHADARLRKLCRIRQSSLSTQKHPPLFEFSALSLASPGCVVFGLSKLPSGSSHPALSLESLAVAFRSTIL
jgi:hypothetical protein